MWGSHSSFEASKLYSFYQLWICQKPGSEMNPLHLVSVSLQSVMEFSVTADINYMCSEPGFRRGRWGCCYLIWILWSWTTFFFLNTHFKLWPWRSKTVKPFGGECSVVIVTKQILTESRNYTKTTPDLWQVVTLAYFHMCVWFHSTQKESGLRSDNSLAILGQRQITQRWN